MVESSKILTVSYGTFSCTLEGFEDSFSTMKAIAEYFRDLAERDRYFGAEPPTPDAEMLTRIAEREIDRRVEARTDDNGIVLRAAAALSGDAANVTAMPPAAQPPAEEDVAEVEVPEIAEVEETAEPVAEVEAQEPLIEEVAPEASDFHPESDEEMDVAGTTSFEDMAPENLERAEAHPDADSIAAKLQRIRSVVGGAVGQDVMSDTTDEENAPTPFVFDAGHRDEAEAADETEIVADLEDAVEDEPVEAVSEETDDEPVAEEPDAPEMADEADATELAEEELVATEDEPQDDVAEAEAFFAKETAEAEETVDDEAGAEAQNAPFADIDSDLIASIAANVDTDAAAEEAEGDTPAASEKPTIRARILRAARPKVEEPEAEDIDADEIKLDDVVSAIEGSSEEVAEENNAPASNSIAALDGADELTEFDDIPVGSLPEDEEAELQADLAAALSEDEGEADASDELTLSDDDGAEEEIAEVAEEEPLQLTEDDLADEEAHTNRLPENDDEAMSRIMDQADEQLSEPEGSRRRNAIAQLKAAVAATEAARQLGDAAQTPEEAQQEFRKDFDEVVRPRRADRLPRAEVRTERPRPAPLKLVASQRVDEEQADTSPVAPRRIAADEDAMASADNFAEYAAEVGATELQDLLEAAAAYSAYVEGNEDFSRPQIMRWVKQSSGEDFSREDSLRSFGTLLRDGRITKVSNGRFQVTEQTRFRPEQKAG